MNAVQTQPINPAISDFHNFTGVRPGIVYSGHQSTCIVLRKCVDRVIADFVSLAEINSNTVTNDVFPKMLVSTDSEILASVIGRLLYTIITNSENNNIRISAKPVGNITLIHLRSSNAIYIDAIATSIQKIELEAETIGGCLTLSNNKMHGLTLAFTFINH